MRDHKAKMIEKIIKKKRNSLIMGNNNIKEKSIIDSIELRKDIKAKWPKKLKAEHLGILSMLFDRFLNRFRYGLAGHNYVYVEFDVYDCWMERILEVMPYKKSVSYSFINGKFPIIFFVLSHPKLKFNY